MWAAALMALNEHSSSLDGMLVGYSISRLCSGAAPWPRPRTLDGDVAQQQGEDHQLNVQPRALPATAAKC